MHCSNVRSDGTTICFVYAAALQCILVVENQWETVVCVPATASRQICTIQRKDYSVFAIHKLLVSASK